MLFERVYDDQLAQASYLIGCEATGEAVVIDANRLVDQYIAAAEAAGLTITAVTETHIHADFVSGARELAARTGARLYLSGAGPPEWQYGFRSEPQVSLLQDGSVFRVGRVELRAVHTPGHTPEHLSFLVTDTAVASEPIGVVTGDFVFVGDVGRPDLLEKAAHIADTAAAGARQLYRSLAWFKRQPDHLQVWPGHGAGSACGKGLSAVPQSTVGYERRYNWALGAEDEESFVRQVLAGQPEPPRYFGHMKRINREGPPVLGALPLPERVGERRLVALLAGGATVVDTRPGAEFAGGHLPGSLNIPLGRSFVTYAGSILGYDRDLYFVLADPRPEVVAGVARGLVSIGLDRIRGYLSPDVLEAWTAEGRPLATTRLITVRELAAWSGTGPAATVVDVRNESEWAAGHLPGARLVPLAELADRLGEIPEDGEIVVHCQGGARSDVAASVLMASGRSRVTSLVGGFGAWLAAGLPVTRD